MRISLLGTWVVFVASLQSQLAYPAGAIFHADIQGVTNCQVEDKVAIQGVRSPLPSDFRSVGWGALTQVILDQAGKPASFELLFGGSPDILRDRQLKTEVSNLQARDRGLKNIGSITEENGESFLLTPYDRSCDVHEIGLVCSVDMRWERIYSDSQFSTSCPTEQIAGTSNSFPTHQKVKARAFALRPKPSALVPGGLLGPLVQACQGANSISLGLPPTQLQGMAPINQASSQSLKVAYLAFAESPYPELCVTGTPTMTWPESTILPTPIPNGVR
jgi:hypothetical protein